MFSRKSGLGKSLSIVSKFYSKDKIFCSKIKITVLYCVIVVM